MKTVAALVCDGMAPLVLVGLMPVINVACTPRGTTPPTTLLLTWRSSSAILPPLEGK